MNRNITRQFLVIFTFVLTLVMNGAATSLPLNGMDTGAISDLFPNFFTPAGYVFAIWGVIYTGLLAFTIYHSLPSQRNNPRMRRVGWLFIVSNLFNSAWIAAWHYLQFPLSLVLMLGIGGALLALYMRLENRPVSTLERWVVHVPFSIYFGWISVATIANTTVVLQYFGFQGGPLPGPVWSVLVMLVGTAIAVYILRTRGDVAYGAVFVWAFIGIAVRNSEVALVAYTAAVLAAVVLVVALMALFGRTPPATRLQGSPA
ncbi:MAG: tryptophan-rich sensory protein [Caldilineaceae bacterium]|nr:tryptophan-rich sensory protein [Caldilineaceae bacterium]